MSNQPTFPSYFESNNLVTKNSNNKPSEPSSSENQNKGSPPPNTLRLITDHDHTSSSDISVNSDSDSLPKPFLVKQVNEEKINCTDILNQESLPICEDTPLTSTSYNKTTEPAESKLVKVDEERIQDIVISNQETASSTDSPKPPHSIGEFNSSSTESNEDRKSPKDIQLEVKEDITNNIVIDDQEPVIRSPEFDTNTSAKSSSDSEKSKGKKIVREKDFILKNYINNPDRKLITDKYSSHTETGLFNKENEALQTADYILDFSADIVSEARIIKNNIGLMSEKTVVQTPDNSLVKEKMDQSTNEDLNRDIKTSDYNNKQVTPLDEKAAHDAAIKESRSPMLNSKKLNQVKAKLEEEKTKTQEWKSRRKITEHEQPLYYLVMKETIEEYEKQSLNNQQEINQRHQEQQSELSSPSPTRKNACFTPPNFLNIMEQKLCDNNVDVEKEYGGSVKNTRKSRRISDNEPAYASVIRQTLLDYEKQKEEQQTASQSINTQELSSEKPEACSERNKSPPNLMSMFESNLVENQMIKHKDESGSDSDATDEDEPLYAQVIKGALKQHRQSLSCCNKVKHFDGKLEFPDKSSTTATAIAELPVPTDSSMQAPPVHSRSSSDLSVASEEVQEINRKFFASANKNLDEVDHYNVENPVFVTDGGSRPAIPRIPSPDYGNDVDDQTPVDETPHPHHIDRLFWSSYNTNNHSDNRSKPNSVHVNTMSGHSTTKNDYATEHNNKKPLRKSSSGRKVSNSSLANQVIIEDVEPSTTTAFNSNKYNDNDDTDLFVQVSKGLSNQKGETSDNSDSSRTATPTGITSSHSNNTSAFVAYGTATSLNTHSPPHTDVTPVNEIESTFPKTPSPQLPPPRKTSLSPQSTDFSPNGSIDPFALPPRASCKEYHKSPSPTIDRSKKPLISKVKSGVPVASMDRGFSNSDGSYDNNRLPAVIPSPDYSPISSPKLSHRSNQNCRPNSTSPLFESTSSYRRSSTGSSPSSQLGGVNTGANARSPRRTPVPLERQVIQFITETEEDILSSCEGPPKIDSERELETIYDAPLPVLTSNHPGNSDLNKSPGVNTNHQNSAKETTEKSIVSNKELSEPVLSIQSTESPSVSSGDKIHPLPPRKEMEKPSTPDRVPDNSSPSLPAPPILDRSKKPSKKNNSKPNEIVPHLC